MDSEINLKRSFNMNFLESVKGFFGKIGDTLAANKVIAIVVAVALVAGTVGVVLIVDS